MSFVLQILLGVAACLLVIPTAVLFLEVLLAVTKRGAPMLARTGPRPRVAILMPAHNEALIIAGTLESIAPQLSDGDRLIVVADNCTDETASIASTHGAEVLVRTDTERRGKGYALDFGVRHLERDPPGIVIIMDADCQVGGGCVDTLARDAQAHARPIQALYLMHAPPGAALKLRVAQFAWVVKNQVRPEGLLRAGLPCQLMGTGMAFPWSCIHTAQLASGHIVEDLKLGIDLARAGTPAMLCPDALVTSQFPVSTEGVQSQRTRWEHGHLAAILTEAPRLLASSVASLNGHLLALALDLSVPPLALLALLTVAVWIACTAFYAFAHAAFPFWMASVAVVLFGVAVSLSWIRYGRKIISLGGLALAVTYALWKIPLYVRFLVARQVNWVRSKRDTDS